MRITARPRVGGRRAAAVSAVTARPPAGWGGDGASRRTVGPDVFLVVGPH